MREIKYLGTIIAILGFLAAVSAKTDVLSKKCENTLKSYTYLRSRLEGIHLRCVDAMNTKCEAEGNLAGFSPCADYLIKMCRIQVYKMEIQALNRVEKECNLN